jgi:hypothetical protein
MHLDQVINREREIYIGKSELETRNAKFILINEKKRSINYDRLKYAGSSYSTYICS